MSESYDEYRELVAVAVEHALLVMGKLEFHKIQSVLHERYGITTANSLDNPEYLKNILRDYFGNSYQDILDTIYQVIDDKKDVKVIKDFLYVMGT
ncbi:hypothetical protein [Nitrosopumilus piranensis]|uniref:Nitrosopumilus output domain-containing protein n=1 Tax=Nitrosopumilus piranensis TaxID=1582439 RepID=A0A0C5CCK7_9ARCH|nr:hypothetical protein [Nitrosopumilus piranensis]AJM92917.1 hypothetical protein NPIRD3C_1705 [Nitrosopumilus piranensis]